MRSPLLIVTALFCCVGCSRSGSDRIVGIWIPDLQATELPSIPIPGMQKRVNSVMSRFVLKLRSDRSFVVTSGAAVEGKWVLTGDTITLTPLEGDLRGPLGDIVPPVKTLDLKLKPDYSRITIEQQTPVGSVTLVLRKSG